MKSLTLTIPDWATEEQVKVLLISGMRAIKKATGPQNLENTRVMTRLARNLVDQIEAKEH